MSGMDCMERCMVYLGRNFGHVVEGAKGDEAMKKCRQRRHIWSICRTSLAIQACKMIAPGRDFACTAAASCTNSQSLTGLSLSNTLTVHGHTRLVHP